METLHFSITIQASREKVWSTLWSDRTYRQWSGVFAAGSHIQGDWNEGGRIRFMDGSGNGVYAIIQKKIPNKLMSFINLGELFEGREQVADDRTCEMEWFGAVENYWLNEKNGNTVLWVEMEVDKQDTALFIEKFPTALEKLKDLAEGSVIASVPFYQAVLPYELSLAV